MVRVLRVKASGRNRGGSSRATMRFDMIHFTTLNSNAPISTCIRIRAYSPIHPLTTANLIPQESKSEAEPYYIPEPSPNLMMVDRKQQSKPTKQEMNQNSPKPSSSGVCVCVSVCVSVRVCLVHRQAQAHPCMFSAITFHLRVFIYGFLCATLLALRYLHFWPPSRMDAPTHTFRPHSAFSSPFTLGVSAGGLGKAEPSPRCTHSPIQSYHSGSKSWASPLTNHVRASTRCPLQFSGVAYVCA